MKPARAKIAPAAVGEFIDVEITATQVYDLVGTPV